MNFNEFLGLIRIEGVEKRKARSEKRLMIKDKMKREL
jgi:hypothetical protein